MNTDFVTQTVSLRNGTEAAGLSYNQWSQTNSLRLGLCTKSAEDEEPMIVIDGSCSSEIKGAQNLVAVSLPEFWTLLDSLAE